MSASSTVSNSYVNNNSWLQPKGHGLSSSTTSSSSSCSQQPTTSNKKSGMTIPNGTGNRRPSKIQPQQQDGFARSTASSRSRAGTTGADDSGVTQNAIYEAFAQAEKQLDTITTKQRRPSDLRRKSLAETSARRRSSRVGDSSTLATGTTPPTASSGAAGMLSPPQRTRAQSLAVVSNTRRRSTTTTTTTTRKSQPPSSSLLNPHNQQDKAKTSTITNRPPLHTSSNKTTSSPSCSDHPPPPTQPDSLVTAADRPEPGLVRLSDVLQNTLAVERQRAKEGLSKQLDTTTKTIGDPPSSSTDFSHRHQQLASEKSSADIIYHAKRRLTTAHQHDTEATPKTAMQSSLERRASLMAYVRQRPNDTQPSPQSPDTPPVASTSLARRTQQRASLSLKSQASPRQSPIPQPQQQQRKKSLQPIVTTCPSSSSSSSASTHVRVRKKSMATNDPPTPASLARRRRSRTESLKDGIPIIASPTTTPRSKKKSLSAQEAATAAAASAAISAANKPSNGKKPMVPPPTYTRKRGKTLPGNLAKPPVIQPIVQLPPMKMEPIQMALPEKQPKKASGDEETTISKKKTPVTPRQQRRSSTAATPNKKKVSPNLISTSRRPSMPQLSSSSARKLSISVAKQGGWYTYGDHQTPTSPGLTATATAAAATTTRRTPTTMAARKQAMLGRKNSLGNPATGSSAMVLPDQDTTPVDKESSRAMSLHAQLQAMVAQHTTTAAAAATTSPRLLTTTARQTQLDDHRLRTHRLSEPFLYAHNDPFDATPPTPKSAPMACQLYGGTHLSSFERQQEIQAYSNAIYFVGSTSGVKASHYRGHLNHGFDDERGDYLILRGDHLAYRYEILDELGKGSFGQVVKCFDHKTNTSVAIKLIRNKRRFHEQALMEVKILKDLVEWDPDDGHHNVRMTDYFYFRNHLCIVCECLSINLYEFIKKYEYKGFAVSLIKRFAVQLLRSLCLLYDHDVIHCDLKPENILLKHPAKSTIKVIDFGSSCFTNEKMYTYIQSRFYRAPEIILGTTYNTAIDMWSFGCILAELYTGIPIFPGETEQEQLACMMEVLGLPPMALMETCSRRKLFFDTYHRPRPVINSRGKTRVVGSKTLASVLRCSDHHEPLFLDFIQSCLQWDPDQRLSPYDALQHPWFTTSSAKPTPPPAPVVVVPT
ncbi:unnamed protein product [Absidia cylindrospora]